MMYLTISILRNKNKPLTLKNLKIIKLFFKHKNIYHIYIFSFFLFVLYFISMITQKEFVTYILIYTLFLFFKYLIVCNFGHSYLVLDYIFPILLPISDW